MLSKRQVILSAIVAGVVIGMLALYIPPLFARQDAVSNFAVLKEWSAAQPSTPNPCTLRQAWEATQDFARGWSRDAGLIYLVSVDAYDPDVVEGKPDVGLGGDGRRRSWQAMLTSPRLNKQLFLQIVDGEVVEAIEDGAHDPGLLTISEKPVLDSPELVQRARSICPDFRAGEGRGVGYHFIFESNGLGTHEPTLKVRGSRQTGEQTYPAMGVFSQRTSQVIETLQYGAEGGAGWTEF